MPKLSLVLSVAALALAPAVQAAVVPFSGTFSNTNPPAAPGGRCAALTVDIGNFGPFYATGTSNLGSFTGSQSHCLDGGPPIVPGTPDRPYYDGLFTYSFASGDTLSGTYTGLLSNAGTPGLIDNVQHFLITGGTGLFASATGSFLGTGQIVFGAGPPAATLTISRGIIDIGPVPEPAAWAMLITGFAVVGVAQRRRRAVAA